MGVLLGFLIKRESYKGSSYIKRPVSVLPWVRVGPAVGCRLCRRPARPPAPCPGSSGSAASRPATIYFYFTGIVSRDEYFFKVFYKSKQYFLNERLWFSQFQVNFLWRKSKLKFLLVSMKSLTNCEIHSSNPLQRACSGFLIAACRPRL